MNKDIKTLIESFFDDMFDEPENVHNDKALLPEEDEDTKNKNFVKLLYINSIDYCENKDDFIEYIINICNIRNILKYIYHNTTDGHINIYSLVGDIKFPDDNDIVYEKYETIKRGM